MAATGISINDIDIRTQWIHNVLVTNSCTLVLTKIWLNQCRNTAQAHPQKINVFYCMFTENDGS